MRQLHHNKFVNAIKEEYIKATRQGRSYLLIENRSAGAIYINFDTHADSVNGIEIAAGGNYERETSVPDNDIYIIGTSVDPALQRVNISEGYG